jgi:hypothetical protein
MEDLSGPVVSRFVRGHDGYEAPAELAEWESAVTQSTKGRAPRGPGGSMSGSGNGWDDSDL